MPNSQVQYLQNYLTAVIFRVDYGMTPILDAAQLEQFKSELSKEFPHINKQQLLRTEVLMNAGKSTVQQSGAGEQLEFRKVPSGSVVVVLGPTSLSLQYGVGDYLGLKDFESDLQCIFQAFEKSFSVVSFSRVGLRYVNEIRLPGRPMEWEGFINASLLSAVNAGRTNDRPLLRSMHQLIEGSGENQIMINYGIVNPDYPNAVVQKHFVIDIDVSRSTIVELKSLNECVAELNDLAVGSFEGSIEGGLRTLMGPKKNEQ